jgi:hypothetical protein
MFHVIKTRLARLGRKITADQLAQDSERAARHGWTVTQVGPCTWRYRDPRFDQLKASRTAPAPATGQTWARAALAERLNALDLTADDTGKTRRWS